MERFERSRPHDPARVRLLAEFGLVGAALIWGFNFILVKMAIGHMPPVYYVGLRFLVGAVFLLPVLVGADEAADRQGWLIGLGVGVLLFGGFVLQTVGLVLHLARCLGFSHQPLCDHGPDLHRARYRAVAVADGGSRRRGRGRRICDPLAIRRPGVRLGGDLHPARDHLLGASTSWESPTAPPGWARSLSCNCS